MAEALETQRGGQGRLKVVGPETSRNCIPETSLWDPVSHYQLQVRSLRKDWRKGPRTQRARDLIPGRGQAPRMRERTGRAACLAQVGRVGGRLPKTRPHLSPCHSSVLPDDSRASRQRTRVVRRSLSPVFNHTMVYDGFGPADLRQACAELSLWDHGALASRQLGGTRLSLGTGEQRGALRAAKLGGTG